MAVELPIPKEEKVDDLDDVLDCVFTSKNKDCTVIEDKCCDEQACGVCKAI
jgi:hypothetical protein